MAKHFQTISRLINKVKKWLTARWRQQSNAGHFVDMLAVVMFSLVMSLSMYTDQTIATIFPIELVPVIIAHIIFGVWLYLLLWLVLPNAVTRLLASAVLSYMLLKNFAERYESVSGILSFLLPEGPFEIIKVTIAIGLLVLVVRYGFVLLNKFVLSRLDQKNLLGATRVFLFFVGGWLAIQSFYIVVRVSDLSGYSQDSSPIEVSSGSNSRPDIYYIVYDRYPSNESLQSDFQFDNSKFTEELKQEGFYIRKNAHSNYQYTAPSVASTLDMDYHHQLTEKLGGESIYSTLPYAKIIRDSRVVNTLNAAGYESHYISSWWEVTQSLANAQPAFRPYVIEIFGKTYTLTEYQKDLLKRSFIVKYLQQGIGLLGKTIAKVTFMADDRQLFLQQQETFEALASAKADKPRFVFGHVLNPHPPYVFSSDGNTVGYDPGDNDGGLPRRDKMINQLQYTNEQIIRLIKNIKANSKTEPIIILQADEGPYPLKQPADWIVAEPQAISGKMSVLAAYYLPDVVEEKKVELNSNVNAFRFVFNNYFGARLDYLPDCQYVFNTDLGKPYIYTDVTHVLDEAKPECTSK